MNSFFNYQSLMYQEIFKFLNHKTVKMNFLKSLKGIFSVIALVGFVTIANAADETTPRINFEQVANEKVKLSFENMGEVSFLTILNDDGEAVYYETIKNSDYAKVFDLHILKDGVYLIKVEFENRIIKQNAAIDNNLLTLGLLETIAKPVFQMEMNNVSVRVNDFNEIKIGVEITNENGYVIYKKTETAVDKFGKLYLLNELVPGDYAINVTINNIVYSEYITVR
jgi:hypothetical protein